MKIYKVYGEHRAESRENSAAAFESIIMEQNANEGSFFTDFESAKKEYDDFRISKSADRQHTAVTFYTFDGKLIEEGEIDDAEYRKMIEDEEDLRDIFYSCKKWSCISIETSAPYEG